MFVLPPHSERTKQCLCYGCLYCVWGGLRDDCDLVLNLYPVKIFCKSLCQKHTNSRYEVCAAGHLFCVRKYDFEWSKSLLYYFIAKYVCIVNWRLFLLRNLTEYKKNGMDSIHILHFHKSWNRAEIFYFALFPFDLYSFSRCYFLKHLTLSDLFIITFTLDFQSKMVSDFWTTVCSENQKLFIIISNKPFFTQFNLL